MPQLRHVTFVIFFLCNHYFVRILSTVVIVPFTIFQCRLLPLYFPREKHEEEVAIAKLPADVGDENGETIIDERKIRIKPLPKKNIPRPSQPPADLPVIDVGLVRRLVDLIAIQIKHSFLFCFHFSCLRWSLFSLDHYTLFLTIFNF